MGSLWQDPEISPDMVEFKDNFKGGIKMGQRRHAEEQIIEILRESENGLTTVEICCKHNISDATFYGLINRWYVKRMTT